MSEENAGYLTLASYHRCAERIQTKWPAFLAKREDRLRQQARHGIAMEKTAEGIVDDLFAEVLDWQPGDLDHQVEHADIVLTQNFIKYLVIEVKRPGALAWHRSAVQAALDQARRYADEQRVSRIAATDGVMLYAADIENGVHHDRLFVRLDRPDAPLALWWVSVHGIYRAREGTDNRSLTEEPLAVSEGALAPDGFAELLHPKYKLPARCFAYVGNAADPHTWKLPHLDASGAVDERRLPKAIQAVLSNFRGVKVGGIPEPAIPDVLTKLEQAAQRLGRMPGQGGAAAPVYLQLAEALSQIRRAG